MKENNEQNVAERVIDHFGNVSATAKAFGCFRQEVQRWRADGKIPFRKGSQVEELTCGAVSRFEVYDAAAK